NRIAAEDGWIILRGNREGIERGFRGFGWEVRPLPDGTIAGRPPAGQAPDDLEGILVAWKLQQAAGAST
ncbi:MAG: hypothetical protein ACPHQT_09880, partial [Planctomycetota bacterium]